MSRIDYYRVAPEPIGLLGKVSAYLSDCSIDPKLRALVELRASQINGCVFCVDMHSEEARKHGEDQQRLDTVAVWREAPFFDDREKAALAWAESLTHVSRTGAPDDVYENLTRHFSDKEVVDLTVIVAVINAWNRIAVGSRHMPARRVAV